MPSFGTFLDPPPTLTQGKHVRFELGFLQQAAHNVGFQTPGAQLQIVPVHDTLMHTIPGWTPSLDPPQGVAHVATHGPLTQWLLLQMHPTKWGMSSPACGPCTAEVWLSG